MNNNMNRKMGNGMGYIGRFPAVCVADLPGEAMDDILRILKELDRQENAKNLSGYGENSNKCKQDANEKMKAACPEEDEPFMEMDFSSDGEEVFGKMLDDLVYMFQLVSAMYSMLFYMADNRMSRKRALQSGRELMEEADSVLEEWQRYSMTEE